MNKPDMHLDVYKCQWQYRLSDRMLLDNSKLALSFTIACMFVSKLFYTNIQYIMLANPNNRFSDL